MTDEIIPEEKPARAPRKAANKEDALPQSITAIIPLIRTELGVVGKGEESTSGTRYSYRGHDTLINAIAPLLNKYGVFTTVDDELLRYEGRASGNNKWVTTSVLRKAVTFHAPDGSSVTSTVIGESQDYSNKATNQSHSYSYRKAIEQTFTIPTGEADPDSERIEFEAPGAVPTQAANATQPTAPASNEVAELKLKVKELFEGRGVAKEEIAARGTAYFNGREGWDKNVAPLRKLVKALENGEEI